MNIFITSPNLLQIPIRILVISQKSQTPLEQPLGRLRVSHVVSQGIGKLQVLIGSNTCFNFL